MRPPRIPFSPFFLAAVLAAGCASTPQGNPWKGTGADTTPTLLGVFRGILPCADCPGLQTELILTQYGPHIAEGTYVLKETYLERSVEPLVTRGAWTTLKGDAADDEATVYQLDPEKESSSRYFLRLDARRIEQLDRQMRRIDSKLNFTLEKSKETRAP